MRPSMAFVVQLPMKTVVNISARKSRSCSRVSRAWSVPSRPMFRTQPQRVAGSLSSSKMSQARRRCSVRFFEPGLYRTREKSPWAAHRRRFSMVSQGVSRSEREITQKSCMSGAPSTAAPESAAVTPGTTSISTSSTPSASWSKGPAMP